MQRKTVKEKLENEKNIRQIKKQRLKLQSKFNYTNNEIKCGWIKNQVKSGGTGK